MSSTIKDVVKNVLANLNKDEADGEARAMASVLLEFLALDDDQKEREREQYRQDILRRQESRETDKRLESQLDRILYSRTMDRRRKQPI